MWYIESPAPTAIGTSPARAALVLDTILVTTCPVFMLSIKVCPILRPCFAINALLFMPPSSAIVARRPRVPL